MCKAPITIKNPNYGLEHVGLNYLKDTEHAYLNIPCGVCDECIANKQMQLVQRVQMEAECNHVFFCTLTYNNEMIPTIVTSTGHTLRYADPKDFVNMAKRIRKNNLFPRPWRYFLVSERGSRKARPHFHALFFLPKQKGDDLAVCRSLECELWRVVLDNWSRNVGTNRKPIYKPLLTYHEKFIHGQWKRNFDLHYIQENLSDSGIADVGFYVLKYMTKPSSHEKRLQQALKLNLPIDEYEHIWSVVRSRSSASLGFGLSPSFEQIGPSYKNKKMIPDPFIKDYVRKCIDLTPKEVGYPFFYNPVSGQSFPLSRVYRSRFIDIMDAHSFYFLYNEKFVPINRDQQIKKWQDFVKKTDLSLDRGASIDFDLFD